MSSTLSPEVEATLREFGWTLGPEFERRYVEDAWVFNLVNALEAVTRGASRFEAEVNDLADQAVDDIMGGGSIGWLPARLHSLVRQGIVHPAVWEERLRRGAQTAKDAPQSVREEFERAFPGKGAT